MTVADRVLDALDLERARRVAGTVVDPELPMLTLADLGVLRSVEEEDGRVVVTLTPTYTGCPALATMRADVAVALRRAGFDDVAVHLALSPAWSSDWISERGRRALASHGTSPPRRVGAAGPVDVVLAPSRPAPRCPVCGSEATRELSRFGSTACRSLQVCGACGEPFDHLKEI